MSRRRARRGRAIAKMDKLENFILEGWIKARLTAKRSLTDRRDLLPVVRQRDGNHLLLRQRGTTWQVSGELSA